MPFERQGRDGTRDIGLATVSDESHLDDPRHNYCACTFFCSRDPMKKIKSNLHLRAVSLCVTSAVAAFSLPASAQTSGFSFNPADVVVSVEGDGSNTGSYTDNQAAPLTLMQFATNGTTSATFAGSQMLPTINSGSNYGISGEYGSSSEGTLQLSGNGQYLTIMGYGINPDVYNANPAAYGPSGNTALGQTYAADVSRVVAVISANGTVNTSTALSNVYDQNNPRSAYTVDGSSFYVSGQGAKGDTTGGVYYAKLGATSATPITGADGGGGASQDTREVQIVNGQLVVSVDTKTGTPSRSMIGTLGAAGSLPTSVANGGNGPTALAGITGTITLNAAQANNVNQASIGTTVNLSPENYYFANATTLYVADSGSPKIGKSAGDGGLQKWTLTNGSWTLDYTISQGLNLVANTAASGSSGLFGLTGEVVNGQVELFATNYTLSDTGQTYLYGLSDLLTATTAQSGESFSTLETAPADSNFKGVSFAPVSPTPLPPSMLLFGTGIVALTFFAKRRKLG